LFVMPVFEMPVFGAVLCAGLAGAFKLLTGARSYVRPEFMPELRIRLPLPSRALDTPYCANAELLQATRQRTVSVIFI
jgi:hypothetical protein